jgi:uncharacterized protein YegJ (DUF2314 family)
VRILVVALLSFVSPLFWAALLHFVVPMPALAWLAMILAWGVTPVALLCLWRPRPSLNVMPIGRSEPEMREAIARAQADLPRFLAGLAAGTKEAFVKYPMSTRGGTTEHVWGVAHYQEGQDVVVSLASEPVMPFQDGYDARERVPLHEIEDWILTDRAGRAEGGYSHLAMVRVYRRI